MSTKLHTIDDQSQTEGLHVKLKLNFTFFPIDKKTQFNFSIFTDVLKCYGQL